MGFYLVVLVTLIGVALSDDHCPPPKELLPCTCDEEGVNCMKAKSVADLKKAFSARFKYNATRNVWVQGTPITSLTADAFGNIKSRSFFVEVNNISTVDLNAFRASKNSMSTLSLFKNLIVDFPYSDLKDFKQLQTLNLGRNLIHTIPDNAFQSESLWFIILTQNQIRYIGRNAFANLPSLGKLTLGANQLVTIGPQAFASYKHGSNFVMTIDGNSIVDIDDTAFEGLKPHSIYFNSNQLKTLKKSVFMNLALSVGDHNGQLGVPGNPLTCRGCDYSWIVLNKNLLENVMVGFKCVDGTELRELTESKIQCRKM